jgi:hypothetical protein
MLQHPAPIHPYEGSALRRIVNSGARLAEDGLLFTSLREEYEVSR